MALGLQLPTLPLIEVHNARIGKEADPLRPHLLQRLEYVGHHLLTKPIALITGMHSDIPDRGFEHPVTGATGETNQPRHPRIMAPQTNLQKAVGESLAHPTNRASTPANSFQQLLQLHQVKRMDLAEHQGNLIVWSGAQTGLFAVLLKQRRLWNLKR